MSRRFNLVRSIHGGDPFGNDGPGYFIIVCLFSVIGLLLASQPLFAAERIVKMVVPGCE